MSEMTLHTNHGPVAIELFDDDAPKTVQNFRKLAADGFYDGLTFHRVIRDFMIRGGCPQGTGMGGPDYTFEDEFNQHKIVRGALAMANSGPNTNGSQFFIVTKDAAPWLDGKHTVFGRVTAGMEAVDAIEALPTGPGDNPFRRLIGLEVPIPPEDLRAMYGTKAEYLARFYKAIDNMVFDRFLIADDGERLKREEAARALLHANGVEVDARRLVVDRLGHETPTAQKDETGEGQGHPKRAGTYRPGTRYRPNCNIQRRSPDPPGAEGRPCGTGDRRPDTRWTRPTSRSRPAS